MSEDGNRVLEPAPGAESAGQGSFGARLAAAREAAGISVGDMAARLRLHVNQVRALEEENLAQLPEPAYVRGFVRSYARALELEPAPLVEDFNRKLSPPTESVVDGMTRAQDYSPVRAAAQERASRRLVLGLAVVALLALGVIGWWTARAPENLPAPTADAPAAAPDMAVTPVAATEPVTPAAETPPAEPVVAEAAASPAAALPAAAPAEKSTPAEPAPVRPPPVADPAVPLMLHFKGVSWVEVKDAGGNVLVSQLAREGDVLRPAGTLPLSVVIGDAANTVVTVRGQAFDLAPIARANVARFTVK